jgi:hypothetical protein
VLFRVFLIGAVAGIVLAQGLILYKIDTGLRTSGLTPSEAARTHRAFW